MSAAHANSLTEQARERFVKRDDIYTVESMIRERAESGWWTLTLMPFSGDKERADYVAMLLTKNGYTVSMLAKGNVFGLDIDWFLKDDTLS